MRRLYSQVLFGCTDAVSAAAGRIKAAAAVGKRVRAEHARHAAFSAAAGASAAAAMGGRRWCGRQNVTYRCLLWVERGF